jgi:hypothetical protein
MMICIVYAAVVVTLTLYITFKFTLTAGLIPAAEAAAAAAVDTADAAVDTQAAQPAAAAGAEAACAAAGVLAVTAGAVCVALPRRRLALGVVEVLVPNQQANEQLVRLQSAEAPVSSSHTLPARTCLNCFRRPALDRKHLQVKQSMLCVRFNGTTECACAHVP